MYSLLLALALIVSLSAVLAAELRTMQHSVAAYAAQGVLLALLLAGSAVYTEQHALYLWGATVLVSKGLILPYLLYRHTRGTRTEEEHSSGPLDLSASLAGAAVVASAAYVGADRFFPWLLEGVAVSLPVPGGAGAAVAVMAVALWTVLLHRDTLKVAVGICLLENGVHLLLVSLAASIPETAAIGIVADVILAVWLLLLVGKRAETATGSRVDTTLDRLHG